MNANYVEKTETVLTLRNWQKTRQPMKTKYTVKTLSKENDCGGYSENFFGVFTPIEY